MSALYMRLVAHCGGNPEMAKSAALAIVKAAQQIDAEELTDEREQATDD